MSRLLFRAVCAALLLLTMNSGAGARAVALEARVSISSQTMTVIRSGRIIHRWRVSTAGRGYVTPRGRWSPKRMHLMWHSRKYHNSPMPYSIFYHKGFAVHGTNAVRSLGRPASHGCVRLDTAHAAILYGLVQQVGPRNTRIIVGR